MKLNDKNKFLLISGMILCTFLFIYRKYGFSIFGILFPLFSIFVNYLYFFKNKKFNKYIDYFVKYRYVISLIIFLFLLLFKISGSSIGMYDSYLVDKNNESIKYNIFSEAKGIRSDEWLVMTPYNISQNYNNNKIYSNFVSVTGQNMIIGYNSPVKDITILAKPISWGYILFGAEYGLSWYWCMKTILFFLLSFELCMIITKKDKKLSIIGSLLITYGPSTQWWFAPHMPDVILYFMALFVMIYHLVSNESSKIKNLLVLLLPFTALGYVIALFPSFQVGLGYFLLVLFVALMIRDKNKFYKEKENIIRIIIIGIVSILLIGYFLYNNLDALKSVSNTVYPGSRMETGGNLYVKDLFTDLGTPFLSYKLEPLYGNSCEDCTYIHFGIFFLMLLPLLIKNMKKNNDRNWIIGLSISIIMIIYAIFMIVGFPLLLSKLTFFNYINRMKMIYGLISVIFTIWGFKALEENNKIDKKYYYLAIFSFGLLYISFIDSCLKNYLQSWVYYGEILFYALILFLIKGKHKNLGYGMIICLITFSSICINPIITGISAITNHPSTLFIEETIKKDNDSYWMSYNSIVYQGYLISLGTKTINAVNFYPDIEKWKIIDPSNKYEEQWNRYAHILVNITDNDNYLTNEMSPDAINAYLNNETIYKLGVKYVISNSVDNLEIYNDENYVYNKIYSDSSVSIYELVKQ